MCDSDDGCGVQRRVSGAWRGEFRGAPETSAGRVAPHQLGVRVKRGESGHREQAGDWGGGARSCVGSLLSSVRRHGRMHRAHRAAHVTQCSGCNVKLPCVHGGAALSRIQPTHLPGSQKFSPSHWQLEVEVRFPLCRSPDLLLHALNLSLNYTCYTAVN